MKPMRLPVHHASIKLGGNTVKNPTRKQADASSMLFEAIKTNNKKYKLLDCKFIKNNKKIKLTSSFENTDYMGRALVLGLVNQKGQLEKLASRISSNRELEVLNCSELKLGNPGMLMVVLKNVKNPTLKYLDLSNCNLNDEQVKTIVNSNNFSNLIQLKLSNNNITDQAIKEIATSKLSQKLEVLDISCNTLTSVGFKYLAQANFQSLKGLYLARLAGDELISEIKDCGWIRNVMLLSMKMCSVSNKGAEMLSHIDFNNLHHLDFCLNNLGDKGFTEIVTSKWRSQLQTLECLGNEITYKGVSMIVKDDLNLETLDISGNLEIGNLGISYIVENLSLKNLRISSCQIDDYGAKMISQSRLGSQLRTLEVRYNHLSERGFAALKQLNKAVVLQSD